MNATTRPFLSKQGYYSLAKPQRRKREDLYRASWDSPHRSRGHNYNLLLPALCMGQVLLALISPSLSSVPNQGPVCRQTSEDLKGLLPLAIFEELCNVGMESSCGFTPCFLIIRQCLHTQSGLSSPPDGLTFSPVFPQTPFLNPESKSCLQVGKS